MEPVAGSPRHALAEVTVRQHVEAVAQVGQLLAAPAPGELGTR